jgi:dual specificity tyrosine-phosphorylation-regulated kinase 2/3/4
MLCDSLSSPQTNGANRSVCLTPTCAKERYCSMLTGQEWCEIVQFPEIYFVGTRESKERRLPRSSNSAQFEYFQTNPGDHIAYRYEVVAAIGKGAFGEVFKCFDHKLGRQVAIKALAIGPRLESESLREVECLQTLAQSSAADFCCYIDSFTFRSHLFIVSELLGNSIFQELQQRHFQGLPMDDVCAITRQLLMALEALHGNSIIHGDLKPENVLFVQSKQSVRLIDFGCSVHKPHNLVTYIQSRFYRAPEVVLRIAITSAIDIWSLGCIIVELLAGVPLFPATDEADLFGRIVDLLGHPPTAFLQKNCRRVCRPRAERPRRKVPLTARLATILRTSNPACIDFCLKCLKWDPAKRLTAKNGLAHVWIQSTAALSEKM